MRIGVIGAGSWGTALAQVLALNGHEVCMWARRQSVADGITMQHRNPDYLAGHGLSPSISASPDYAQVLGGADAVVVVSPSKILRQVAVQVREHVGLETPVIICSKGLEESSGLLPYEIFTSPEIGFTQVAALCGPNHAEEVIQSIPCATVVASQDAGVARFFQDCFAAEAFRVYTSADICGVELCAAYKNVIAIAVGVSYGLGYGDNTAAMIMTRGLAEMSRLVRHAGGQEITCLGLAGAGDLIVTCTSEHSRNRRFGQMVAQGLTLDDFGAQTHMVAEGAYAARALQTLEERYSEELPLCDCVRELVWNGVEPGSIAQRLISRPLKDEF